jgi:hypothetical protein
MRFAAELTRASALCLALATPAARAQSGAASALAPPLAWQAPADCPGREDVLSQVAALAQDDSTRWDRFASIRGEVARDGGRWLLRLEFVSSRGSSRREMSSGRCAELAEAAALAIVLAHRSDAAADIDWNEAPAAAPAPQTPASTGASDAAPDTARTEPASTQSAGTPASLAVAAEVLLDPSTLGALAFGAAVGVELRRDAFSGGVYGAAFPHAETALGAGQAIELALWTGGARGCLRWGRSLDTCAHFELGRISAQGVGLVASAQVHDLWAAPGLSAAFMSSPFDGFGVTTRLSLYYPLVRGRFRVDESEVVHRIPVLAFRVALGVAIPLF